MDIIKILGLTAIIGFTFYHLIKKYFDLQYGFLGYQLQNKYADQSTPLKLQAYERLILLVERITIPNLISRLKTKNMRAEELINASMIAINQEFEFNLTQQLYISDNLWKIISLAKDEVMAAVHESTKNVDPNASADVASAAMMNYFSTWKSNPLETARQAIKNEVSIMLPK